MFCLGKFYMRGDTSQKHRLADRLAKEGVLRSTILGKHSSINMFFTFAINKFIKFIIYLKMTITLKTIAPLQSLDRQFVDHNQMVSRDTLIVRD